MLFFNGPIRNPFFEYLNLRGGFIEKFVQKIRFCMDWGVFTGCADYFYDTKITGIYKNEIKTWYLCTDKNPAGLNFRCGQTGLTLSFYYHEIAFFMNEKILDSAKKYGDLQSLLIEQISCSSLTPNPHEIQESKQVFFRWNKPPV